MSRRSSPEIAETFASYYEKLYTTRTLMTDEDCDNLLKDVALVALKEEDKESLEGDLTVEEMMVWAWGVSEAHRSALKDGCRLRCRGQPFHKPRTRAGGPEAAYVS
ncbi:hypothetical protein NDU88_006194 [Pleurodeles waltl]|uniref:Uncharacterized protein n=1 Tax=Pleurodeles waltl TaxID=8319 RepID=A0AAV7N059_PLEWA|nr:hypothetical protein NDU88_006194 [Pleurodeles waltl]